MNVVGVLTLISAAKISYSVGTTKENAVFLFLMALVHRVVSVLYSSTDDIVCYITLRTSVLFGSGIGVVRVKHRSYLG